MNDIQKCQFEILKAFIEVCEKNNLRYYLCGGSCLGAVRHKGFIPWDDDVDVIMPRKDYEKFLTMQSEFKDPKYFIQTYKTDPNFIYNYAKVRDSSTTFIENFYVNHQMNHGVWIDIFPQDGFSKVVKEPKKFKNKVLLVWADVYLMYLPALKRKFSKGTWFKDLLLNIVAILFFWGNVGHYRNKLVDRRVKKLDFDTCPLVGTFFGTNPKKEAMPNEIFGEGSDGIFEGMKVKLPKDPDKYLTLLYGDYMKLPPIEKQVGHHYNKGLDLNTDYITYRKQHKL